MYIDPSSVIVGVPALRLREFLRRAGDSEWDVEYIAACLEVPLTETGAIIQDLLRLGYVEPAKHQRGQTMSYARTLAGSTFALASAGRPLTRKTAERKLQEFLERVRQVNASDYYLWRVRKVVVFGSYLTGEDRINDIDVAVDLVHHSGDREERMAADRERIQEARKRGRQFSNIVEELLWPYSEVLLFLKARSRAISLHTTDDGILKQVESQVLYEEDTPGPS